MANRLGVFHPRLWSELRGVQTVALPDRCKVLVHSESFDAYNNVYHTYAPGDEISCRYYVQTGVAGGNVELLGQTEVPWGGTSVFLPLDTAIVSDDRIRITQREGENTTDEDYEVVGHPFRGTTALIVKIRLVDKQ